MVIKMALMLLRGPLVGVVGVAYLMVFGANVSDMQPEILLPVGKIAQQLPLLQKLPYQVCSSICCLSEMNHNIMMNRC